MFAFQNNQRSGQKNRNRKMSKSPNKQPGSDRAMPKKKKKSPKRNYRQLIISLLVGLALIAFILPDLLPLFSGGSGGRSSIPPNPNSNTSSTMPEPSFTKEGELSIISNTTGEIIKKIDIEKADNDMERAFGMMYRKSMQDTRGMLFLFEEPKPQSFWMKNTYIPLDIIYIDENKKITTIHPNATPLSESSLPSKGNAQFVLEVRGGFCQDYGVQVGDSIDWN